MSTLIIILMFLAMLHLVYQGVVLPAIRLKLRNRLFSLRDEVRNIMIKENKGENDLAFMYVDDGICNLINRLPLITLSLKSDIEARLAEDVNFKEEISERMNTIRDCGHEDLIRVFEKTYIVVALALVANSGGWLIYALPIVLPAYFLGRLVPFLIKKLIEISAEIVAMKRKDAETLIPLP